MLANQIRPTTLSAAVVFRYIRFWPKKHRVLPFLAIALLKTLEGATDDAEYHHYTEVVAGLHDAVGCPNVTRRPKERIAQNKLARAGSLAMVD